MKNVASFVLTMLLAMTLISPAWRRTVLIETTVPLADDSEETLKRAMNQAIQRAVQGATALGLSWVRVDGAQVFSNALMLRMIATDGEPNDDDGEPDAPGTI